MYMSLRERAHFGSAKMGGSTLAASQQEPTISYCEGCKKDLTQCIQIVFALDRSRTDLNCLGLELEENSPENIFDSVKRRFQHDCSTFCICASQTLVPSVRRSLTPEAQSKKAVLKHYSFQAPANRKKKPPS